MNISKLLNQYRESSDFEGPSTAEQIIFQNTINKLGMTHNNNETVELSGEEVSSLIQFIPEIQDWIIQYS